MKKVININFQGQVIAIEETAYELLKQYIDSLKNYFAREEGGDEIVNDIENRIAELFGNRLKHGITCITDEDVESIVASIGKPEDFDTEYGEPAQENETGQGNASSASDDGAKTNSEQEPRTLYRNENDKIIAGVCSGLAHYFRIDPVWVRLVFVLLFSILFWVYLLLWIVLKPQRLESNVTKRLYRNPNDKMIGGVCGGIAAYFKIESWIPRVVFAVPLLLNLIGMISFPFFPWNKLFNHHVDFNWNINLGVVIVYIILWIIIPLAATVKQKLEMMGEDEYIKSIRETVSDNVANVKNRAETEDTVVDGITSAALVTGDNETEKINVENIPPAPPKNVTYHASATPQSERSGCLNAFILLIKIIFFAFVGIFAVVLVGMLIAFLFAGASFMPLKSLFIDAGTETNLLIWSIILMVAVPIISIVIWIVRRAMKAKSRPVIGIIATILWFVGISLAGVMATKVAEKFKVESSVEKNIQMSPFKGDKLYLEMAPYMEDYYTFKTGFGPGADIDDLPYYTINEDSLLFSNIRLQIINSEDSLYHVKIIASTNARTLRKAKSDINEFTYSVQQEDSVLTMAEFFKTPIHQGFRNQNMVVEVSVPTGKKVEVSEDLETYRHNRLPKFIRKKYKRKYSREYDSKEEVADTTTVVATDSI